MQLNEIIEENTLPSISRKTRISVENLEALVGRDWGRLKKVQALGFISILEREYQIDLSDLREDCREYFAAHQMEEETHGPMIGTVPERDRHGLSGVLIVLVVLLAGAGGYVLFFSPSQSVSETNTTTVERQGGFFDSVLSRAQSWFGASQDDVPESEGASEAEVPAVKGAWAEENMTPEAPRRATSETAASNEEKQNVGEANATEEAGENNAETPAATPEAEEARIIQQVKKEQAKAEELRKQATEEANLTPADGKEEPVSEISKMILAATAGSAEPAGEKKKEEEAMEPRVPSLTPDDAPAREVAPAANLPRAEREQALPEADAKQPPQASVTDQLVVMHPRSKIWVGYTNLRTMKRTAKVTADDLTFDTATGDYILAVGHGQIDFKTRSGEKKLNDGKRHFFMIARGDVREISHEEFQRLNKSKVW